MKPVEWFLSFLGVIGLITVFNKQRVVAKLKNVKLSRNFTLSEFVKTSTGLDNLPDAEEITNIQLLVNNVLQPLRDAIKRPVYISSGFRSSLVNIKIGGSPTSSHTKGQASDIIVPGLAENGRMILPWDEDNQHKIATSAMSNEQIKNTIEKLNLSFDQMINEKLWFYDLLKGWVQKSWLHISYRKTINRNIYMIATNTRENTKPQYRYA